MARSVRRLLLTLFLGLLTAPAAFAATCDVDDDGDIDINDIRAIFQARGSLASGPDDPRDADGDGFITVLDARKCVLQCDLERCQQPPDNTAPIADAGPDQTVAVGDTVLLDGSGSSDADGDLLTFLWSFVSRPEGSMAALIGADTVSPSFVVDQPGDYVLQLVVNDGTVDSAPDTVVISTANSAPVADAGPDQSVFVTETVTLDGSGSTDVDGDPLSYLWSFVSVPPGSNAMLSDPTAVMPMFVVDAAGQYVVQLLVNDGSVDSAPDTVTITTLNSPPVADAGPDQTVFVGETVTLDGSGSSDVDGDPLAFQWALTTVPPGSLASLSDPTAVMPTFVIDQPGTYVAELIVNDGFVDSAPDTVQVVTENSAPVADAGDDQNVEVNDVVMLDGSGSSDVDGDPLTFAWSFLSRPPGSIATLSDPTAVMPSFTADVPGTFVVQLIVNDGLRDSAPDTVTIDTGNTAPVADAGPDQTVALAALVMLDGSGSFDPNGDPLTYAWALTSVPPGSSATLSDPNVVMPTFTADEAGTYVAQLVVNDGFVDSAPDSVTISTANTRPVADAGDDQTAQVGDTVTLDGSGSFDADGDALAYAWSITSRPPESTADLSDPNAIMPTLDVDVPGTFLIQLIVNDGQLDSLPDGTMIEVTALPNITLTPATLDLATNDSASLTATLSEAAGPGGVSVALISADPAVASVPPSVDIAEGDTVASFDVTSAEQSGSTTITASADGFTDGTATVNVGNRSLALSLAEDLVGVGRTVDGLVTLAAPAPAGGVDVTLATGDPAIATVSPASVVIAEGGSTGAFQVTGVAQGTTPLTANAIGYDQAELLLEVTRNLISTPTTVSVGLGQTTALPITIAPDPAPPGGLIIDVVSADPTLVGVDTPQVTIPEGAVSVNATVRGVAVGTAVVTASNPQYASDSSEVSTTAEFDILQTNVTFTEAFENQVLTIQLESDGNPVAAPPGGVEVVLTSADPGCVVVASPVTIPAGLSSVDSAPLEYGDVADLPCSTTVEASGAGGITPDTVNVTVDPAPGITFFGLPLDVGAGLQAGTFTARLGTSQHGGVTVRIESEDPSLVLIAPDNDSAGAPFIEEFIPDGRTDTSFVVQGLENVTGTVAVTASAPGFADETSNVDVVPGGLRLGGLPAQIDTFDPDDPFTVEVGVPNSNDSNLQSLQRARIGGGGFTASVSSSDPAIGELVTDTATGGSVTVSIAEGQSSSPANVAGGGVAFRSVDIGTTNVAATIPGFVATDAASSDVEVTAPGITLFALPLNVGSGLQDSGFNARLGASQHGGVTLRLESSDPSRVLLSLDPAAVGQAAIEQFIPDGSTDLVYTIQALEGVTGTATITATAAGFETATGEVSNVTPSVRIISLLGGIDTLDAPDPFQAQVGVPNSNNTNLATSQEARAGGGGLTVTLTNSDAAVGELATQGAVGQSVTVSIAEGQNSSPLRLDGGGVEFRPLTPGTTTVAAALPGFVAVDTSSQDVQVTAPDITLFGLPSTVGSGLQRSGFTARLGASQHGGVTLRLESSDPSRVLLSLDPATPGQGAVEQFLPNGSTDLSFTIHGLEGVTGTAVITATATGFDSATGDVTIVSPAFRLTGLLSNIDTLDPDDAFQVQIGAPNSDNTNLASVQESRAGGGGVTVTVTNSDDTVGELVTSGGAGQVAVVEIGEGLNSTPINVASGGVAFSPLTTGLTTVAGSIPGFIATDAGTQQVEVTAPGITLFSLPSDVGAGLQSSNFTARLSASQHGGVTLRIESSNPSVIALAPDATTPGSAFIELPIADGFTDASYTIQALEGASGTVTLTASASGFLDTTGSVTAVTPGLRLVGLQTNPNADAADDPFQVQLGTLNGDGSNLAAIQAARVGGGGLTATLSNSVAAVGQLVTQTQTDQVVTVAIAEGANVSPVSVASGGVAFDALAPGSTIVSGAIPGFVTSGAGNVGVTVNPALAPSAGQAARLLPVAGETVAPPRRPGPTTGISP
jgi:hypothetical protein